MRGCQHLVLWTDGDREGEGIAAEIVEVVTRGKYAVVCVYSVCYVDMHHMYIVKSRGLQVHRARFSEITRQ